MAIVQMYKNQSRRNSEHLHCIYQKRDFKFPTFFGKRQHMIDANKKKGISKKSIPFFDRYYLRIHSINNLPIY